MVWPLPSPHWRCGCKQSAKRCRLLTRRLQLVRLWRFLSALVCAAVSDCRNAPYTVTCLSVTTDHCDHTCICLAHEYVCVPTAFLYLTVATGAASEGAATQKEPDGAADSGDNLRDIVDKSADAPAGSSPMRVRLFLRKRNVSDARLASIQSNRNPHIL